LLQQCATKDLDYEMINPIALEAAIAPHIAAEESGKNITVSRLLGYCRGSLMCAGQFNVVEGAGGWRVPVNNRETIADLAKELRHPVILVVGIRLGCINHTLLTVEAILRDGLTIAGWVANCIDPDMPRLQENIDSIEKRLAFPLLGKIDFIESDDVIASIDKASEQVNIESLLN
jgi:dethiobiotin synthetase